MQATRFAAAIAALRRRLRVLTVFRENPHQKEMQ